MARLPKGYTRRKGGKLQFVFTYEEWLECRIIELTEALKEILQDQKQPSEYFVLFEDVER